MKTCDCCGQTKSSLDFCDDACRKNYHRNHQNPISLSLTVSKQTAAFLSTPTKNYSSFDVGKKIPCPVCTTQTALREDADGNLFTFCDSCLKTSPFTKE